MKTEVIFILFIFIVICPAVLAAYIDNSGKSDFKNMFLKSLGWLYGITFFNLMMLYIRGWGEYDFKFLSVQFLFKYMLSSIAAAVAGLLLKRVLNDGSWKIKFRNFFGKVVVCLKKFAKKAIENLRKNNVCPYYKKSSGIVVSCSISFLLCFFAPLDLFFNNWDEFWYDLGTLLPLITIIFVVAVIVVNIFMLFLFWMNKKLYQFAWILEFVLFICSYIQGNYLTGNLPPLDGTQFSWADYISGRTASILLWCAVIVFVAVLFAILPKKRFYRLAQWTAGGISMVLALTLCIECFITKGYQDKINSVVTTKNQFQMSENQNFVILLLDALDAGVFQNVLEDNPEYKESFADFTFYPDTMGAYPFTSRSVPFILSGEWYENDEPFPKYAENVYKNSKLFAKLEETGWQMGVYEIEMPFTDTSIYRFENVCEYDVMGVKSFPQFVSSVCRLTGFKYAPFDVKRFCNVSMEEFNTNRIDNIGEYDLFGENNQTFYTNIQKEDITLTEKNCFKWIHVEGAHVPFRYDKDVRVIEDGTYEQNVEASLTIASAYINKLKTSGVYDNSVIIIMADHGYNWAKVDGRQNPLLMVKGSNEHHNMQVSQAPLSYEDLQEIYKKLLDGVKGDQISDWKEGDKRERRYLWYVFGHEENMSEYVQEGYAANTVFMHPTGREYIRNAR